MGLKYGFNNNEKFDDIVEQLQSFGIPDSVLIDKMLDIKCLINSDQFNEDISNILNYILNTESITKFLNIFELESMFKNFKTQPSKKSINEFVEIFDYMINEIMKKILEKK